MVAMEPKTTPRGRRTWVAIVLALLWTSLGMMYLGRGWRALFYFIALFVVPAATLILASNGHWVNGVGAREAIGALSFRGPGIRAGTVSPGRRYVSSC